MTFTKIEQAMTAVTGLTPEELRAKRDEMRAAGKTAQDYALWLTDRIESEGHSIVDFVKVHQLLNPGFKVNPEQVTPQILEIAQALRDRKKASGE